jgi:hypothetical protein
MVTAQTRSTLRPFHLLVTFLRWQPATVLKFILLTGKAAPAKLSARFDVRVEEVYRVFGGSTPAQTIQLLPLLWVMLTSA